MRFLLDHDVPAEVALLEAQLLMFDDPELKKSVHESLDVSRRNVEWVFLQIVEEMSRKLADAK